VAKAQSITGTGEHSPPAGHALRLCARWAFRTRRPTKSMNQIYK
jgi:hypothetical protein